MFSIIIVPRKYRILTPSRIKTNANFLHKTHLNNTLFSHTDPLSISIYTHTQSSLYHSPLSLCGPFSCRNSRIKHAKEIPLKILSFSHHHWQQSTFIEADFPMADSDLLCNEETKSFVFDDHPLIHHGAKQGIESPEALPCLTDECIAFMVKRESEHLPRYDYLQRLRNRELDVELRKEALDSIFKVNRILISWFFFF